MRVSLFYSLAFVTAVAAEQCGDTTLHCFGDSIPCMAGDADFAFHPKDPFGETFFFLKTTSQDGWYCDCPDNLTGLRCAREYEECRGTDHFCYHGGKCITDLNATVSDSELFCDCSEAMHNSMPYRGKFCEVELERCTHDSEVFCANNGQCKDDFANKLRPCECSSAFRGPHCEFDDGHVPNCNLVCENNGECARGIKTYSTALHNDFFARHDGEFQYCDCQDGFYGLKCEAAATDCGDAQCFHGGACVETENSKNETIFACDCSDAKSGGVSYAGQYCQSPSVKNCGDKGANGQLFCTNGGECKADAHEGCECKDGFHGESCEHAPSVNPEDVPKCDLTCRNGGKCRTGKKDTSLFSQFGEDMEDYKDKSQIDFQHCVCPDGYFGIECEHQLDVCPGGEHVCLHGSKCVPVNESDQDNKAHQCDCEDGFDALHKFAGKFCQYESTDICTKNGQPGVSKANTAFCVNNGKCKGRVDDTQEHPGCDCQDKYTGPHCEFIKGLEPSSSTETVVEQSTEDGSAKMPLLVSLAVILVALIVVVVLMICSGKKKKKADKATESVIEAAEEGSAQTDPAVEDFADAQQEEKPKPAAIKDGNLQTVEII